MTTLLILSLTGTIGFGLGVGSGALLDRAFWNRYHYCPTCDRLEDES